MFEPIKPKKETLPAARNPVLETTLCKAIRGRLVARLRYKNEIHYRTFEPHIIYQSSTRKFLLGGWQTRDDSKPLKRAEWREFEVGLINSAIATDKAFQPDSGFNSFRAEFGNNVICAADRL